jgi:hypothetical protein
MKENDCLAGSFNGILVAADAALEWILPWWWERYSSYNKWPVAFVDYGMNGPMLNWCRQKGAVISFQERNFSKLSLADEGIEKEWKALYGLSYSQVRQCWFKKTIWVDLDCEILAPLDDLFSYCQEPFFFAIAKEHRCEGLDLTHPDMEFNSGVFVYEKDCEILSKWAELVFNHGHQYGSDDRALSSLIRSAQYSFSVLPSIYNWRMAQGVPLAAKIIHWCGEWGKQYIRKHGGLKEILEQFPELIPLSQLNDS